VCSAVSRNVQQRRGGGVAGAQRRAGEGGRVRARPGAGVPDPAQLVRRLHPGQDGGGRQVPADAEHERPPRAVLVLRRPRRHPRRRRVAFAGESRRGWYWPRQQQLVQVSRVPRLPDALSNVSKYEQ
jgi:hypothetical protein